MQKRIVGRRRGCTDGTRKSLPDQPRGQTAMVDVGVRQQQGVDLPGVCHGRLPIAFQERPFLKHPAIDQQLDPVGLDVMLRAGYLAGGSQKLELHGAFLLGTINRFSWNYRPLAAAKCTWENAS